MPEEWKKAFQNLSVVDTTGNDVDLKHPNSGFVFSIGAADLPSVEDANGVVTAKSADGSTTSVSHVTDSGKGQVVVVVEDQAINYKDFHYELPPGYQLKHVSDGGFTLENEAGEMEGRIEPAWAVDANGQRLATNFELVGDNTLRQHVSTENAEYPVVMDPSWAWWIATSAACLVEVSPIVVTGGAAAAARLPRLVSTINKLARHARVAAALKRIGGVGNGVKAIVKSSINKLKSRLPKKYSTWLKRYKLSAKDVAFVSSITAFIGDNLWDILGFGKCKSLWDNRNKGLN